MKQRLQSNIRSIKGGINCKSTIMRFLLCLNAVVLFSCRPAPVPSKPNMIEFNYAEVTRYGAQYAEQGIESNVYMLDLYTPGLTLNKEGIIEGTGYNLCFSDVFTLSTDTRLLTGVEYTADSTGRADTFLPGQDFDGNINGAYLLEIQDGKVTAITLYDRGAFRICPTGDTTEIHLFYGKMPFNGILYAPLTYKRPL